MKKTKLLSSILIFFIIIIGLVYDFNLKPVSDSTEKILFTVKETDTLSNLGTQLKEKGLIRSVFFYKLYIKINNSEKLQSGDFYLSESQSLGEIIDSLEVSFDKDVVNITFVEGFNYLDLGPILNDKLNIASIELSDSELNSLIEDYWFLSEEIKNTDIKYPLEGYLYPNTYQMSLKWDLDTVIRVLLDETEKQLEPYKSDIMSSEYTIHELITLASIIEIESFDDKDIVAGVFYNRLKSGDMLGSDVTTYYGLDLALHERNLLDEEIYGANEYNTRSTYLAGKLPVSAICNPSIESIKASIYPADTDYYYFVADKYGVTYFNYTNSEHINTINRLKSEGLWYTYED